MKKVVILAGALMASTSFATLSNEAVSKAKVKPSAWETFKKKTSILYFGELNDTSIYANDKDSAKTNQGYLFNAIIGRYDLNDTWKARLDVRFTTSEGVKDKYTERNLRVGVQGLPWVSGNWSVFSIARLELPTTSAEDGKHKIFQPMLYNSLNYSSGAHSGYAAIQLSKWLYESGEENAANDSGINQLSVWFEAYYYYSFTDRSQLQLVYEHGGSSRTGQSFGDYARSKGLERYLAGMNFLVAKSLGGFVQNVNVYPHLEYKPHFDNDVENLGVGAWISAIFF